MPNSFDLENHVRCFNHTLQLSAKTLLHPFNVGLGKKTTEDGDNNDGDDLLDEELADDTDNDDDDDGLPDVPDVDDINDGIDEMNALDADEREEMLADTAAVRQTVTKVRLFVFSTYDIRLMHIRQLRGLAFAIVRSTTIALPAWRRYCKELNLKPRILSRDVVTRWNSTYYMLSFAIRYRAAIDAMTADKSLKLWKFELETEEWAIAEDLVSVLLVRACTKLLICILTFFHSNTKMQPCFSPKTVLVLLPSFPPWTRLQATSTTRLRRHIIPLL